MSAWFVKYRPTPISCRGNPPAVQRRPKAKMASERGLSGLSWPPSFRESVGVRASAVRLSAPCQTRHWMMMTTMITIACSPAHREAPMRRGGGRGGHGPAEGRRGRGFFPERPPTAPLPAAAANNARAGPTSQRRDCGNGGGNLFPRPS